jgi:hypothetical protein
MACGRVEVDPELHQFTVPSVVAEYP